MSSEKEIVVSTLSLKNSRDQRVFAINLELTINQKSKMDEK
ncbi:MAG: hypothetical protein O9297_08110 [Flavobacterium sp.]|jgi:hypothetical protein|nr:hypothetical protein [Flavobacterium sp.]